MKTSKKDIGRRIKTRREELGLTQEDIASMAGLSRSHVVKIEGGGAVPRRATLLKIAQALHVEEDYFSGSQKSDASLPAQVPEPETARQEDDLGRHRRAALSWLDFMMSKIEAGADPVEMRGLHQQAVAIISDLAIAQLEERGRTAERIIALQEERRKLLGTIDELRQTNADLREEMARLRYQYSRPNVVRSDPPAAASVPPGKASRNRVHDSVGEEPPE